MQQQRVTGCEALIRRQYGELGLAPPSQFTPIAEDSRLIIDISNWMLEAACIQMRQWQLQALTSLLMAINLSA